MRNRLSNIALFGIEQFCSVDIMSVGSMYFNLLAKILVFYNLRKVVK